MPSFIIEFDPDFEFSRRRPSFDLLDFFEGPFSSFSRSNYESSERERARKVAAERSLLSSRTPFLLINFLLELQLESLMSELTGRRTRRDLSSFAEVELFVGGLSYPCPFQTGTLFGFPPSILSSQDLLSNDEDEYDYDDEDERKSAQKSIIDPSTVNLATIPELKPGELKGCKLRGDQYPEDVYFNPIPPGTPCVFLKTEREDNNGNAVKVVHVFTEADWEKYQKEQIANGKNTLVTLDNTPVTEISRGLVERVLDIDGILLPPPEDDADAQEEPNAADLTQPQPSAPPAGGVLNQNSANAEANSNSVRIHNTSVANSNSTLFGGSANRAVASTTSANHAAEVTINPQTLDFDAIPNLDPAVFKDKAVIAGGQPQYKISLDNDAEDYIPRGTPCVFLGRKEGDNTIFNVYAEADYTGWLKQIKDKGDTELLDHNNTKVTSIHRGSVDLVEELGVTFQNTALTI